MADEAISRDLGYVKLDGGATGCVAIPLIAKTTAPGAPAPGGAGGANRTVCADSRRRSRTLLTTIESPFFRQLQTRWPQPATMAV
jgi:hypothetical protein